MVSFLIMAAAWHEAPIDIIQWSMLHLASRLLGYPRARIIWYCCENTKCCDLAGEHFEFVVYIHLKYMHTGHKKRKKYMYI